ncbi:MAG: N-acetylmuramoyl-L-alanine amidase-like domain-containing protein [Melioribacteraceae bacterium]
MKILFFLLFIFNSALFSQAIYTDEDVNICKSKFEFAVSKNLSELPINDVIVEIGKTFLGLEYEAFTLEKGENEKLVIHFSGLDCYTFFESSLVFARCIKKGKTTFEDYQNELTNVRYRNGIINDYPSRLHYASDWLYDNSTRGIVKNVTEEIGGISYNKKIDFMSTHSESYKQLKNNPNFIEEMKSVEDSINNRKYYYVPEKFIECVEDKIQNGDIILLTTGINGLDISHTGIAVKMEDEKIHFMHAPLKGNKIEITKLPLDDYVKNVEKHTGIMVGRLIEP